MNTRMIGFDFTEFCRKCHVNDMELFYRSCLRFRQLLESANQQTNLTRITDLKDFWDKHIADSISITQFYPEISSRPLRICDIGCGAGFPSLILKLAFNQLALTAVDSVRKKTDFVRSASEALGVSLDVVHCRAKELSSREQWQGRFDIITARAVGTAQNLVGESRRLLTRHGRFIFYKTPPAVEKEIGDVRRASKKYHFHWEKSGEFLLPGGRGRRQFLVGSKD